MAPCDGEAVPNRWSAVVSTKSRGHHRHRPGRQTPSPTSRLPLVRSTHFVPCRAGQCDLQRTPGPPGRVHNRVVSPSRDEVGNCGRLSRAAGQAEPRYAAPVRCRRPMSATWRSIVSSRSAWPMTYWGMAGPALHERLEGLRVDSQHARQIRADGFDELFIGHSQPSPVAGSPDHGLDEKPRRR